MAFPIQRVMPRCFFVSVCPQYRQMSHPVRRKIIFCLSEVQKSDVLFMKKLSYSSRHLGDYFHLNLSEAKQLIWPSLRTEGGGGRGRRLQIQGGSYRAQILILHLLELGVSVASAQLHISQNHLEHGVVNGLREMHVKLIHRRLRRKERDRKRMSRTLCHEPSPAWKQQEVVYQCIFCS